MHAKLASSGFVLLKSRMQQGTTPFISVPVER
jgi:hypothetical protein